ncbi:MAG: thioesterase family protein [Rhodospirillaceae bacterium]|jgi:acyl-CoA thioester hydrolase
MPDAAIDLTDARSFAFWTPVTIRYCDQDDLGHVNNCSYPEFLEVGRVAFLGGLLDPARHPGIDFILAHIAIDFIKEAHFPGIMQIGARVLRLGTKSMTTGYGVFLDGSCRATAECVNIYFRKDTRETIAIPPDIRAQLEADPMQKGRAADGNAGKMNR